jgi:hypothetical protein
LHFGFALYAVLTICSALVYFQCDVFNGFSTPANRAWPTKGYTWLFLHDKKQQADAFYQFAHELGPSAVVDMSAMALA